MVVLEPKAQIVKITKDYKAAKVSVKLDQINLVDKMDLHRQTREIVFKDVMQTSLGMIKLQTMVNKIQK
jgi:hypothetical protein